MQVWKNIKKVFNKKIILVAITIITLVSSLGGAFLFLKRETPPEDWDESLYSKPEDYVIKETEEGKIVENDKAGLSFKVPEGWRIEKPEYSSGQIRLYSEGAEENSLAAMEQGCRIIPMVTYINTSLEAIENDLRSSHGDLDWLSRDDYETIEIDGYGALRNILEDSERFNVFHIGVYIPGKKNIISEGKLYSFDLTTSLNDKEDCRIEFEQFLEALSIN